MGNWRIKVNFEDYTERAITSSQTIGATAILSTKGPREWTFFNKGDTQKILDVFGYPTKDNQSIQTAVDLVAKSAMWVASPYKSGLYGGVFVTPSGTIPFVDGASEKEFTNYNEIPCNTLVGIGNEVLTTFTIKLPNYAKYNAESLGLKVGATELTLSITKDAETGVETFIDTGEAGYTPLLSATGNSFNPATGDLTVTFEVAPADAINASYTINVSDAYFILFSKDMQADDLRVRVIKSKEVDDAFDITVSRYSPIAEEYVDLPNTYTVGLSENSRDNYGSNIYIENVFGVNQLLFTPVVVNSVIGEFTDDVKAVPLSGGNRGAEVDGADLANLYSKLQDTRKYIIKFAVDGTSSDDVVPVFENLRNNYQGYCRFLYCAPNVSPQEIIADPAVAHRGVTANRGLYCYVTTWGIRKDVYLGNDFLCSNMGLIGGRLVDVLEAGGGVPAYIDENGVGGILGSGITKLMQDVSDTEAQQLDTLGLNPVAMDNQYGAMIIGWRTRQVKLSVYSSIGQSSLADTLLELIVRNVLPPRIGKLIDETSYMNVRVGCNAILDAYQKFLEDYFVLCSNVNNTPETRNQQQLMVSVGVVFKGYAERIIFSFCTYRNGVNVEEELTKRG